MPGPGKSFEAFQADQAACKTYAASQVKDQADAANQRALGTALITTAIGAATGGAVGSTGAALGTGAGVGAVIGSGVGTAIASSQNSGDQANIQAQYDTSFAQCMYAKGELVPGLAPIASSAPTSYHSGPDPMVRATQSELIRLGYLRGGADGVVGPMTRSAVSSYESANGLPVDGAPSPSLLARLQATPATPTSSGSATANATPSGGWVAPPPATPNAGATTAATPVGWSAPPPPQ